ncbi:MAG TPA: response regulator [Polyangiaceae bacterium]|nr:response regulator [Polyangiaceae bacterium]
MTRILIVEDDVEQARGMARVFGKLRPDYSILVAHNGVEATRLMTESPVDLVLTDLQMPEMDGFALLAWMHNAHPDVPVFTMSGVGNSETAARSGELGATDHFPKPLDARAVLLRLSETLAQSVRGHVQNVSLASFLQLLEMERKTCTLTITFDDKKGVLVIQKGVLTAAQAGELTGQAAAIAIIAWQSPSILISRHREVGSSSIQAPLGFILMEAMRIQDEEARSNPCVGSDSAWPPRRTWRPTGSPSQWPAAPGSERGTSNGHVNGSSLGELGLPSGARALALVETATGQLLRSASHPDCPLLELAHMASQVLQQEAAMLKLCIETEGVEELVLSTSSRCDVIRPLNAHAFAMLVFAPEDTNLVMARLELEQFIVESQSLAVQRTP